MPRNENTEEPAGAGRAVAALLVKLAVALVALVALLWVGRQLGSHVPRFALWVDSLGVWGPLVFVAGYSIATVAFIPGSLLTLAAGAIFGLAKGTLFTFFGASFGAAGAFPPLAGNGRPRPVCGVPAGARGNQGKRRDRFRPGRLTP